jgi:hypothetical protein
MCAATGERQDRGPISDAHVAAALRPFVRATRPLLGALSDADPVGLQARSDRSRHDASTPHSVRSGRPAPGSWRARDDPATGADDRKLHDKVLDRLAETRLPGTAAWAAMDADERSRWWVRRVGRLTSVVAAVPGFGGALTRRLPITMALGAVAQGLVLCAIANEHGVHDEAEVVALLGAVLFHRDLSPTPRADLSDATNAEVDARAAELTGDLRQEKRPTLQRVSGALWRMGRALLALEGELERRPHGGRISGWMSMLPVVGVTGKYLGEWSGLKNAARAGEQWIHARHP